jgi:hypothetical protein
MVEEPLLGAAMGAIIVSLLMLIAENDLKKTP